MNEELGLNDLVEVPTGELSEEEKDKYDGTRTKIAKGFVKDKKSFWKDNKQLPQGEFVMVKKAILETEPIGTNSLGEPITVQEEFNLKQHPVTGKFGPSLHEKSNARKLFNKLRVNRFPECIGRDIVVVKKVKEKSGATYLGFSF